MITISLLLVTSGTVKESYYQKAFLTQIPNLSFMKITGTKINNFKPNIRQAIQKLSVISHICDGTKIPQNSPKIPKLQFSQLCVTLVEDIIFLILEPRPIIIL